MGRNKHAAKRQLLLRLPEELYAEALLLHPELMSETGDLRYGAISQYFTRLVKEDVEARKSVLRRQHDVAG